MNNSEVKVKTLISEIEFEKKKIIELNENLEILKLKNKDLQKPDKFDVSAYGYILHNFYNGVENILYNISKVFGNNIDKNQWHSDLLKKMIIEVKDIRPQVISEKIYLKLIDYKNFRHFFRNAYLFELDWFKMEFLVKDFENTIKGFFENIDNFIIQISE
ncbi:MAG TPA: antitoxin [bacterium]|nr:antitoxin [bacterium]